jgi:heme-degrading monooxygenase HmoA
LEQADRIREAAGVSGPETLAEGQLFHLETERNGGGFRVVDVWESEEAFQRFVETRLGPAFEKVGVQPFAPGERPPFERVHNIISRG